MADEREYDGCAVLGYEAKLGEIVIRLRAKDGDIFRLRMSPQQLDAFLTAFATIQFSDQVLTGDEIASSRMDLVASVQSGLGQVEGKPVAVLVLGLKNKLVRILAFHRDQYNRLAEQLPAVEPPLGPPRAH